MGGRRRRARLLHRAARAGVVPAHRARADLAAGARAADRLPPAARRRRRDLPRVRARAASGGAGRRLARPGLRAAGDTRGGDARAAACACRASPARASSRRPSRRSRRSRRGRSGTRSPPRRRSRSSPASATRTPTSQGAALNLKPGDPLLLAGADVARRALGRAHADDGRGRRGHDRTRVEWAKGLGSVSPHVDPAAVPQPLRVPQAAQRLRPQRAACGARCRPTSRTTTRAAQGSDKWPGFTLSAGTGNAVDLDGSHPDVVVGSWVVLSKPSYRELWQVRDGHRAVAGGVRGLGQGHAPEAEGRRELPRSSRTRCATRPSSRSASRSSSPRRPTTTDVAGGAIDVDVDVSAMLPGRRLLVRGRTTAGEEHAEAAVLKQVEPLAGGWRLVLAEDLSTAFERDSVVVHGNVAAATHGETVQQLLGSGRASSRVPALHARARPADVRAVERRPVGRRGRARGAGQRRAPGARCRRCTAPRPATARTRCGPTSRARRTCSSATASAARACPPARTTCGRRYRKGLGAAGNVRAGALAQLLDRPLGVEGRRATRRRRRAASTRSRRSRRAPRSRSACARSAGRSRCSTTRTSRSRSAASSRRSAAVLPLRAGRTVVVTVAFEGGDRLDDLADVAADARRPARRGARAARARRRRSGSRSRSRSTRPTRRTPCSPGSRRRSGRRTPSTARGFAEPVYRSEVDRGRALGRRASSPSTSTGCTPGATPGLADRLLAQQPAVGAGGTRDRSRACSCSTRRTASTGWRDDVSDAPGLYTPEEIYRLLPAVYRVRDAEQGGVLRELLDVLAGPGQRARREPRAGLRRPVRRDVRAVGRALHRRPRRLPDAARRRAAGRLAAGRGREHDPLPAAQGHRLGARAARRRRHRLAGARGRVLRAARDDAVHEPRPAARRRDRRPARRAARLELAGGFQAGAFDGFAHTAEMRRDRARARVATTSRTSASSSGACRPCGSPARRSSRPTAPAGATASTRSGRTSRSSPRRGPRRRSRTSPSRSTCRCRCGAASSTAHLGRALRRRPLAPARARDRPRGVEAGAAGRHPRLRPLRRPGVPGTWAHEPQPADTHVARRPGARPRRLRRARPPRARRGSRRSTTAPRSPSAAAATTAPPSLERVRTRS